MNKIQKFNRETYYTRVMTTSAEHFSDIRLTEWDNGEGVDISIDHSSGGSTNISLMRAELDGIIALHNYADLYCDEETE